MATDSSRIQRSHHLEFATPLNTRMSIKAVDEEKQFWCTFIGLEKERAILIRLDRELAALAVPGNRVIVKYIIENLVFGFMTTVIGTVSKPLPLLFLDYPQSVEKLDLRRENRAICFLPVTICWEGEEYQGRILDISSGGCRVATDIMAALRLADLEVSELVSCKFDLEAPKEIHVKSVVRSISQNDDKLCIGIEFIELPKDIAHQIEIYALNINKLRISCS
ncbi:MAG: flagellar brake protein [Deltaproteobacteria bacterium]|jgi:c-di-GMP-binding flagellar brake protein YcgR